MTTLIIPYHVARQLHTLVPPQYLYGSHNTIILAHSSQIDMVLPAGIALLAIFDVPQSKQLSLVYIDESKALQYSLNGKITPYMLGDPYQHIYSRFILLRVPIIRTASFEIPYILSIPALHIKQYSENNDCVFTINDIDPTLNHIVLFDSYILQHTPKDYSDKTVTGLITQTTEKYYIYVLVNAIKPIFHLDELNKKIQNIPIEKFNINVTEVPLIGECNSICDSNDFKLIRNPHYTVSKTVDHSSHTISGCYLYYHYCCDQFDDEGWGCAYRSIQTIISWFSKTVSPMPVPSIHQLQKILIDVGDKKSSFYQSKTWIGAIECMIVLQQYLKIDCKILNAQFGSEVKQLYNEIANHFDNEGTPILIGGNVKAYTLLGVRNGEYLILDPHYIGEDNIKRVISKGYCSWRKEDIFRDDSFYNFCLPLAHSK